MVSFSVHLTLRLPCVVCSHGPFSSTQTVPQAPHLAMKCPEKSGGAKGPLWRQIIADVLGVELVITNASEGPAFGEALLAGVAGGVYNAVQEACAQTVKIVSRTASTKELAPVYEQAYGVYKTLHPVLKPIISRPLSITIRIRWQCSLALPPFFFVRRECLACLLPADTLLPGWGQQPWRPGVGG